MLGHFGNESKNTSAFAEAGDMTVVVVMLDCTIYGEALVNWTRQVLITIAN